MHKAPRPAPRLLSLLLCAGLNAVVGAQDNVRLPDLGSSANALISPQEAQDYGAAMIRQMRALDMVLDDPLLDEYINDLGFRLVAASDKPRDHFAFLIVKDAQINAFATPGGYVAVNAGLVTITASESELAGVMAHEIGHITQNHLQRAFEDSKKDTPLLALVLLGALAAGAAGAGNAGMAVLAGGQGMLAQKSINFTRKDETEADRVGIQTLARAGFDPNAMASFFERMQDTLRVGAGGTNDVPELLQDHPVTSARISDAKARAGALVAEQKLRPSASTLDKTQWSKVTAPIPFVKDPTALLRPVAGATGLDRYALMRERTRVLSGDAAPLANYYAGNFKQRGFDTPVNRYGYALALTRSNRAAEAVSQLRPLLAVYPTDTVLQLAFADATLRTGHRAEALAIYTRLDANSPRNKAISLAYANALVRDGSKADAARAADLLRPLLDDSDEPQIYVAYASASDKAGDAVRAAEAYAEASYLSGRPFDAMEQLKRLLQRNDLDYYARARIQARIADLTPLVLELRKRHVPTEDNRSGRDQ